ncbi:MAG: hypothetical protein IPJ65_13620 [Archangiaceae bacterium]|nr:hypothetical protein [Archangiaceae bacterium]
MRDLMPRWLTRSNADQYTPSKKHELRLAKLLGGRRLPNSGGARRSKWDKARSQGGDIETDLFLVEHKRTRKASIRLQKEWLTKVAEGAAEIGKVPVLIITFEDGKSPPLEFAIMRLQDVRRLTRGRWSL